MAFRSARATLLFSRRETIPEEQPSVRRLDEVGAVSVLGAMVEQRRRSQPPPPPLDLDLDDDGDSPDESQVRPIMGRVEKKSIGFIKIR